MKATVLKTRVAALVICGLFLAFSMQSSDAAAPRRQFAFWYETWTPTTWNRLSPATAIVYSPDGSRPDRVADEIHRHGGLAIPYVSFYRSAFGTPFLSNAGDLPNVGFHNAGQFLLSAFAEADHYVLCSNSVEVKRRVLGYVNDAIANQKFDGLFIDNAYQPPANTLVCDAPHEHVRPGRAGGAAYIDLLSDVVAAVKAKNPHALVITNAGNPRAIARLTNGTDDLWSLSDLTLWESFAFASVPGKDHDRVQEALDQGYALAQSNSARKVLALAYPATRQEALLSFAMAKVYGFSYAANLGVNQVGKPEADGGHYGLFLQDLPIDIGQPTSPLVPPVGGVLRRSFEHADVVANLGTSPIVVVAAGPGTLFMAAGKEAVSRAATLRIPAGQAAVALYR